MSKEPTPTQKLAIDAEIEALYAKRTPRNISKQNYYAKLYNIHKSKLTSTIDAIIMALNKGGSTSSSSSTSTGSTQSSNPTTSFTPSSANQITDTKTPSSSSTSSSTTSTEPSSPQLNLQELKDVFTELKNEIEKLPNALKFANIKEIWDKTAKLLENQEIFRKGFPIKNITLTQYYKFLFSIRTLPPKDLELWKNTTISTIGTPLTTATSSSTTSSTTTPPSSNLSTPQPSSSTTSSTATTTQNTDSDPIASGLFNFNKYQQFLKDRDATLTSLEKLQALMTYMAEKHPLAHPTDITEKTWQNIEDINTPQDNPYCYFLSEDTFHYGVFQSAQDTNIGTLIGGDIHGSTKDLLNFLPLWIFHLEHGGTLVLNGDLLDKINSNDPTAIDSFAVGVTALQLMQKYDGSEHEENGRRYHKGKVHWIRGNHEDTIVGNHLQSYYNSDRTSQKYLFDNTDNCESLRKLIQNNANKPAAICEMLNNFMFTVDHLPELCIDYNIKSLQAHASCPSPFTHRFVSSPSALDHLESKTFYLITNVWTITEVDSIKSISLQPQRFYYSKKDEKFYISINGVTVEKVNNEKETLSNQVNDPTKKALLISSLKQQFEIKAKNTGPYILQRQDGTSEPVNTPINEIPALVKFIAQKKWEGKITDTDFNYLTNLSDEILPILLRHFDPSFQNISLPKALLHHNSCVQNDRSTTNNQRSPNQANMAFFNGRGVEIHDFSHQHFTVRNSTGLGTKDATPNVNIVLTNSLHTNVPTAKITGQAIPHSETASLLYCAPFCGKGLQHRYIVPSVATKPTLRGGLIELISKIKTAANKHLSDNSSAKHDWRCELVKNTLNFCGMLDTYVATPNNPYQALIMMHPEYFLGRMMAALMKCMQAGLGKWFNEAYQFGLQEYLRYESEKIVDPSKTVTSSSSSTTSTCSSSTTPTTSIAEPIELLAIFATNLLAKGLDYQDFAEKTPKFPSNILPYITKIITEAQDLLKKINSTASLDVKSNPKKFLQQLLDSIKAALPKDINNKYSGALEACGQQGALLLMELTKPQNTATSSSSSSSSTTLNTSSTLSSSSTGSTAATTLSTTAIPSSIQSQATLLTSQLTVLGSSNIIKTPSIPTTTALPPGTQKIISDHG